MKSAWRAGYALGLLLLIALPLLLPFGQLADAASWSWTRDDVERLKSLSWNTFALTTGTVALSLPLGVCLAVLLFRTSFPGQGFFQFLLILSLFVPLPVLVSSWQGFFGPGGLMPLGFWVGGDFRPWVTGFGPAIWICTLAAVPWVTLIVGIGLTWVEPELEDEAAQVVSPKRVLVLVTLPRVRASLLAAVLFVVLQTAGDISVTDMMQVPTLAEEVHTQFELGDRAVVGRTLVVGLPILLVVSAILLASITHLETTLPPLVTPTRPHRTMEIGSSPSRLVMVAIIAGLLAVPLVSLAWKLGLAGTPRTWNAAVAWQFLQTDMIVKGRDLLVMLATTLATGVAVTMLALVGCWLARDCRWFRWLLFGVLTWAWVMPGPIVGIGLRDAIMRLPPGPWLNALYYGPSPLPSMIVQGIRALPIAVVFLWPIVRMMPRELFEEARLIGAGPLGEFVHLIWPMTRRAAVATGLATCAVCLAEVSATLRVETPGWGSFTKLLWDRMHYGVENGLAASCILMLASLATLGVAGWTAARLSQAVTR